MQVVLRLLSKGADIDAKDERGNTSLHMAVKSGYKEIVKQLLLQGATINIENEDGYNPL